MADQNATIQQIKDYFKGIAEEDFKGFAGTPTDSLLNWKVAVVSGDDTVNQFKAFLKSPEGQFLLNDGGLSKSKPFQRWNTELSLLGKSAVAQTAAPVVKPAAPTPQPVMDDIPGLTDNPMPDPAVAAEPAKPAVNNAAFLAAQKELFKNPAIKALSAGKGLKGVTNPVISATDIEAANKAAQLEGATDKFKQLAANLEGERTKLLEPILEKLNLTETDEKRIVTKLGENRTTLRGSLSTEQRTKIAETLKHSEAATEAFNAVFDAPADAKFKPYIDKAAASAAATLRTLITQKAESETIVKFINANQTALKTTLGKDKIAFGQVVESLGDNGSAVQILTKVTGLRVPSNVVVNTEPALPTDQPVIPTPATAAVESVTPPAPAPQPMVQIDPLPEFSSAALKVLNTPEKVGFVLVTTKDIETARNAEKSPNVDPKLKGFADKLQSQRFATVAKITNEFRDLSETRLVGYIALNSGNFNNFLTEDEKKTLASEIGARKLETAGKAFAKLGSAPAEFEPLVAQAKTRAADVAKNMAAQEQKIKTAEQALKVLSADIQKLSILDIIQQKGKADALLAEIKTANSAYDKKEILDLVKGVNNFVAGAENSLAQEIVNSKAGLDNAVKKAEAFRKAGKTEEALKLSESDVRDWAERLVNVGAKDDKVTKILAANEKRITDIKAGLEADKTAAEGVVKTQESSVKVAGEIQGLITRKASQVEVIDYITSNSAAVKSAFANPNKELTTAINALKTSYDVASPAFKAFEHVTISKTVDTKKLGAFKVAAENNDKIKQIEANVDAHAKNIDALKANDRTKDILDAKGRANELLAEIKTIDANYKNKDTLALVSGVNKTIASIEQLEAKKLVAEQTAKATEQANEQVNGVVSELKTKSASGSATEIAEYIRDNTLILRQAYLDKNPALKDAESEIKTNLKRFGDKSAVVQIYNVATTVRATSNTNKIPKAEQLANLVLLAEKIDEKPVGAPAAEVASTPVETTPKEQATTEPVKSEIVPVGAPANAPEEGQTAQAGNQEAKYDLSPEGLNKVLRNGEADDRGLLQALASAHNIPLTADQKTLLEDKTQELSIPGQRSDVLVDAVRRENEQDIANAFGKALAKAHQVPAINNEALAAAKKLLERGAPLNDGKSNTSGVELADMKKLADALKTMGVESKKLDAVLEIDKDVVFKGKGVRSLAHLVSKLDEKESKALTNSIRDSLTAALDATVAPPLASAAKKESGARTAGTAGD